MKEPVVVPRIDTLTEHEAFMEKDCCDLCRNGMDDDQIVYWCECGVCTCSIACAERHRQDAHVGLQDRHAAHITRKKYLARRLK